MTTTPFSQLQEPRRKAVKMIVPGEFANSARRSKACIWKGLLWHEWLAHRKLMTGTFMVWFLGVWVLQIASHPFWILILGVIYAVSAGQTFGGADVKEGSEEFSLSLPPTRAERYLVRLTLGMGTLLFFTVYGLLAIRLDLPQVAWGLFVDSGFTNPFPEIDLLHYAMAFAVPIVFFSFTFAGSALARIAKRVENVGSCSLAVLIILAALQKAWPWWWISWRTAGFTLCWALLGVSPVMLLFGYLAYVRKEGVSRPS